MAGVRASFKRRKCYKGLYYVQYKIFSNVNGQPTGQGVDTEMRRPASPELERIAPREERTVGFSELRRRRVEDKGNRESCRENRAPSMLRSSRCKAVLAPRDNGFSAGVSGGPSESRKERGFSGVSL